MLARLAPPSGMPRDVVWFERLWVGAFVSMCLFGSMSFMFWSALKGLTKIEAKAILLSVLSLCLLAAFVWFGTSIVPGTTRTRQVGPMSGFTVSMGRGFTAGVALVWYLLDAVPLGRRLWRFVAADDMALRWSGRTLWIMVLTLPFLLYALVRARCYGVKTASLLLLSIVVIGFFTIGAVAQMPVSGLFPVSSGKMIARGVMSWLPVAMLLIAAALLFTEYAKPWFASGAGNKKYDDAKSANVEAAS